MTEEQKAELAVQELRQEDRKEGDLSHQADAIAYAFQSFSKTCQKATQDMAKAAETLRNFNKGQ